MDCRSSFLRAVFIVISLASLFVSCSLLNQSASLENDYPYPLVNTVDHKSTSTREFVSPSISPSPRIPRRTPSVTYPPLTEKDLTRIFLTAMANFEDEAPTLSPEELATPICTPAGDGFIVDAVFVPPLPQHEFLMTNYWFQLDGFEGTRVYAGVDGEDPEQGAVFVMESSSHLTEMIHTPVKSGWVKIVDAIGEVIILESKYGLTFYFNMPGLRFVSHPDDIVPTITPYPTVMLID